VPRISAGYAQGSLAALNELIHEEGHAVQYAALRTRPAFMDVDELFTEAFADVTSWNTYEPRWQRKYLGREAPESASLRSRYTGVVLDAAWSLFEIRMLRNPGADPNALWTEITSHYLRIAPHPEWSWWALRVQLVESPGYMINYASGRCSRLTCGSASENPWAPLKPATRAGMDGCPSACCATGWSVRPRRCCGNFWAVP
jgi:hypothetical protein